MRKLHRDGVELAYDEAGSGGPPIVLVHGWVGDHTYLAPQFDHFSRTHRVITVDLRGHGASDKPEQEYTMSTLAGDVAWICEQLDVRKPVIVGHSLGAVTALELAARFPDLPSAIVALDATIVLPPELLAFVRSWSERLWGTNYREEARQLIESMFIPTDDPERRHRIVDSMSSAPQYVLASVWEQMMACPSVDAAAAPELSVPLLAVASAAGHYAEMSRLRALYPRLTTGQTVGAGHFHQLEVPVQVNAMIERFLAVTVDTGSAA